MLKFIKQNVNSEIERYTISNSGNPLSYKDFLNQTLRNINFRNQFLSTLEKSSFDAFRFETPAVNLELLNKEFEFVLINCPSLAGVPDEDSFSEFFTDDKSGVAIFPNLGKNAQLIVPCPRSNPEVYLHIASFCRKAPIAQKHNLFKAAAKYLQDNISEKTIWFSTAGMGVSWLHLRVDQKPKYYHYELYKQTGKI